MLPSSLRTPGFYVEIESSGSQAAEKQRRTLMLLPKEKGFLGALNTPLEIQSEAQARAIFGADSSYPSLCSLLLNASSEVALFAMVMAEGQGSTAAQGKVTLKKALSLGDSLSFELEGQRVELSAESAMSADAACDALMGRVSALKLGFEVKKETSAGPQSAEFSITAPFKGTLGQRLRLKSLSSEATLAVSPFAGGSGSADVASAIKAVEGEVFHYFVLPFAESSDLGLVESDLSRRFGAEFGEGARAFSAQEAQEEELTDLAKSLNSPHLSLLGLCESNLNERVACCLFAGVVIGALSDDPSASLEGVALPNLSAKALSLSMRNTLLNHGVSTYLSGLSGVSLERVISTYQRNAAGEPSVDYLDIQVAETMDRIRSIQKQQSRSRFLGYKLASDESARVPNRKILTPSGYRAFLLSLYRTVFMGEKGWVQDYEHYKETLVVAIHPDDRSRIYFEDEPVLSYRLVAVLGQARFE